MENIIFELLGVSEEEVNENIADYNNNNFEEEKKEEDVERWGRIAEEKAKKEASIKGKILSF